MAKFRSDVGTSEGAGNFLRIKDGESHYVIFVGSPVEFYTLWEGNKTRVVPEGTPKANFRFRMNAVVKENNAHVVKIFENGATVYRMLATIEKEYGDLESVIVKVSRRGTGLETEYTLMPLRQEVPPATRAQIAKLKMHDLAPVAQAKPEPAFDSQEPWPDEAPHQTDDDLPF